MSRLLEKTTDKYRFKYQLPLEFEKQLAIVDMIPKFMANGYMQHIAIWEFIKKDIFIYDMQNKEQAIWQNGKLQDDIKEVEMLKLSLEACQFFISKFMVFMQEAGVSELLGFQPR